MAIKLNELENTGTRWESPTNEYPQGSFINGTGQGKRDGSYAKAEWANDIFGFHGAILKNGGQTPNGQVETAKNSQVFSALKTIIKNDIDTLGGDPSAVASGTVNAITATFTKPVSLEGGKLVKVRAIGANTSPTVTFAPNDLGAKPVVKGNDAPLAVGDIAGEGYWLTMIYDATLQKWVLQNPATGVTLVLPEASESTKGIIQIASDAEVSNGSDVPKAITPKQFKEATKDLGGGLPMGHLFAWPFQTPPDGCIQCNGATYSRTLYEDFWNYISSKGWVKSESEWNSIASANGGYCPWYSDGDGTTNFRTPKFAPFIQVAIASGSVGTYHQAGLPNITGDFEIGVMSDSGAYIHSTTLSSSGAFSQGDAVTNVNQAEQWASSRTSYKTNFSAADSNSTYGKASTVQPESNEWMICVVVLGQATNIGSADVADVMSAIAQVQADVGAIEASPVLNAKAYIKETWHSGSSWYRVWSDGWIEQGGIKTSSASKDETVSFNKNFTNLNSISILVTDISGKFDGNAVAHYLQAWNISTTSFTVMGKWSDTIGAKKTWYACGY